jgi:DNA-binding CsgD family transcriptional regulator
MTAEEIAETLGISASTVRTHLQRIRKQLTAHISQDIVTDDRKSPV